MATAKISDWKKAKRHAVTLPSGIMVEIEVPNLALMMKTGQIPNNLLDAAVGAIQKEQITPELLIQQADFYAKLVAMTVKAPAITEEDFGDLPYEDVEMIVQFATRQIDLDALGHHLGGLHKSAEFRAFRGLDYFDEALVRV